MFLAEPPPSQGDIHFRVFGFPVRVSPFFWLTTVLMGIGWRGEKTAPIELVLWIVVVFVSILVHELGHALVQRHFGGRPWIVLQGLGGLAICNDCDRSPRSQILISLAGPTAGFTLAALVMALVRLSGHPILVSFNGEVPWDKLGVDAVHGMPILRALIVRAPFHSESAERLVHNMLFVNIVWGLVNLLPVYPLDGGRVARELCTLKNPRRGIALSLQISIVAAVGMAAYSAIQWQSLLVPLMFGYLAYGSYQTLQAYQRNYW
jgi:Zn-dependent protease